MGPVKIASLLQKTGLIIRTVRDLKPSQVFFRLLFIGKRLWRSWRGTKASLARLDLDPTLIKPITPTNPDDILPKADAVLKKELTFLNQRVVFEGEIDWDCPGVSRLWRFNLHYMGYLVELATAYELTGESRYLEGLVGWIRCWMAGNRREASDAWYPSDAWHPYPVSLRVAHWVLALGKVWPGLVGEKASPGYGEFRSEWLGSLQAHLRFVQKNLEYDLRGNHLLANCKALILGGIFLGAGSFGAAFYQRGCRVLESQLREQVLADGGHFERSPMYHCLALEDFLTLYEAFGQAGLEPPSRLGPAIQSMARFLRRMILPDGGYPLCNDSAWSRA